MKTEKLAWSVAGIALFVVVVGLISIIQDRHEKREYAQTVISTAAWKTYTGNGLALKYPSEYTVTPTPKPKNPQAVTKIARVAKSEELFLEIFQGDLGISPDPYGKDDGHTALRETLAVGTDENMYLVPLYYAANDAAGKAELHAIAQTIASGSTPFPTPSAQVLRAYRKQCQQTWDKKMAVLKALKAAKPELSSADLAKAAFQLELDVTGGTMELYPEKEWLNDCFESALLHH